MCKRKKILAIAGVALSVYVAATPATLGPASAAEPSIEKGRYAVSNDWVMLQFRHHGSPPTSSEVAKRFGLTDDDVDHAAGVSVTDPTEGLYVVMVKSAASAKIEQRLKSEPADPAVGVFANPRIEPFGPPR